MPKCSLWVKALELEQDIQARFCSCDLDLDPNKLIIIIIVKYEHKLGILMMYAVRFLGQRFQKLKSVQTVQTDKRTYIGDY